VSKWRLCRRVSPHKDQLLQDPLIFKQNTNSSYELFWFFHYIFSLFFTVLVVHLHHDHPGTTVLTCYSPMAWSTGNQPFCAESAVKHQPTNHRMYSCFPDAIWACESWGFPCRLWYICYFHFNWLGRTFPSLNMSNGPQLICDATLENIVKNRLYRYYCYCIDDLHIVYSI